MPVSGKNVHLFTKEVGNLGEILIQMCVCTSFIGASLFPWVVVSSLHVAGETACMLRGFIRRRADVFCRNVCDLRGFAPGRVTGSQAASH